MNPVAHRVGRRLLLVVVCCLIGAGALVNADPAWACSCASGGDDPRLLERAEVVFTGELIKVTEPRFSNSSTDPRALTFAVDRVYKGQAFAEQVVVSARDSASCGFTPSEGFWLVYARSGSTVTEVRPGVLSTDLCSGNVLGRAPASFGPGVEPRPGSSPAVPVMAARFWPLLIGGVLLVGVLASVGVVAWRRSRGRSRP